MNAHVLMIQDSRQAVAYVTGELDIATAPRIREALLDAIRQHEQVTVDLDRLAFCDCAGLSALITAQKTARAQGTTLTVRNIPHQLTRLLRCIPHTLPVEPTDRQSRGHFGDRRGNDVHNENSTTRRQGPPPSASPSVDGKGTGWFALMWGRPGRGRRGGPAARCRAAG
ncbi:STAS domain-containing protein [Streptomyces sp. SKN60]|uniref:STAS domain-containing protein n=1 Tax=Streptomyces sp. SKN60 TaxID=2855506 RepID=UPI0022459BFD|nr:STAS domain-containing protein [Streptomyces sp. SKN60]MCX2184993.1 STAS domain-containing protein [Streptomyces sp. SKN60]